jgi:hypothetical protein
MPPADAVVTDLLIQLEKALYRIIDRARKSAGEQKL